MKTIGVTGGIGSGKSTVCRMLEQLGARVFYADAEARRLMREDAGLRAEIVVEFGTESYDEAGELNRPHIAAAAFGDEEKLQRLNAMVHPRVFRAFAAARAEAERDDVPVLVKEAALIFEAGSHRHLDAVVVVDAPEADRIRRVVDRDAASAAQVRERIRHQLPPDELRQRADYLIPNHGSLDDLRVRVEELYRKLTER
jgi:dephospho-CoA kinase